MADGPTFFGPEGVTKGKASPPPVPQAPKPAKPAPQPFTEVETVESQRRMSSMMWAALLILAAGGLAAGWFYNQPRAPAYTMESTLPLGTFELHARAFEIGDTEDANTGLAGLFVELKNISDKPQVASSITVELLDHEGKIYAPLDFEKLPDKMETSWRAFLGDSSATPCNPGMKQSRGWLFQVPRHSSMRIARFSEGGLRSKIDLPLSYKPFVQTKPPAAPPKVKSNPPATAAPRPTSPPKAQREALAIACAKQKVNEYLLSPASTTWKKESVLERSGDHFLVHLVLDAKNALGVPIRYYLLVELLSMPDGTFFMHEENGIQKCSATPTYPEIEFTKRINGWPED